MHESPAISMKDVAKTYRLYGSQRDQLVDVLGLRKLGLRLSVAPREFHALSDISLDVPRGGRIGIVGRNGAGKTTLLKLICGNFQPTRGEIQVNGTVQALMNIGLGFHPEYTGRQNIEASLQFNGLKRDEHDKAFAGIVEFCELGEYLDQPFKSYSLGMQARLMFAAATSIRPDILIVDEVLGAGDAYFVAKSKRRVDALVGTGCTMLLVSHSMQQVLELCSEAIWLDQGRIRMRDKAFLVVKAYEEYMHGVAGSALQPTTPAASGVAEHPLGSPSPPGDTLLAPHRRFEIESVRLQEPDFLPHQLVSLAGPVAADSFSFAAPGGISRWQGKPGLKVEGFGVLTERGASNELVAMRPAKLGFTIRAEFTGTFRCRYGIAINTHSGACVTRIFSPEDSFELSEGDTRRVEILLNPNQIGAGEYTVGISVLEHGLLEHLNSAERFDLLSRSFLIKVVLPESLGALDASFFHTAEWTFQSTSTAIAP